MTKDEALKLALEALGNAEYGNYDKQELDKAITAIKEALAQPEQEPVASMKPYGYVRADGSGIFVYGTDKFEPPQDVELVPVYLSRDWVGLTDEEISEITSKVIGFNSCAGWEEDYAQAIEAKLKELNT